MGNTRSKVSKNTDATKKANTAPIAKQREVVEREVIENNVKPQYRVKKALDPNLIVTVKNGFQGRLVYKSRRTQEVFEWDTFGDEQDMDLQELKNARNSSKAFFENNWFLIDDPEILEYLGVSQYYKYALSFDTFDQLFNNDPETIKETIGRLSIGQKKSVAYRAKQLIADGVIDSIKVISALEESLSIELIDR